MKKFLDLSSWSVAIGSMLIVAFAVVGCDDSSSASAGQNDELTYGTMTDSRDGKVYRTVKIGDQTWMAENLNYSDSTKTPSLKGKSWCYNNVAANCDVAGRLYTWAAAIDSVKLVSDAENPLDCGYGKTCSLTLPVQGICDKGWHLPSQAEWSTLITKVGGRSTAGTKLKSQSGWYINGNGNGNGDDAFGFSALPAGDRGHHGYFDNDGDCTSFWSSTENGCTENGCLDAYYMFLYYNSEYAKLDNYYKDSGFSVRCVKD